MTKILSAEKFYYNLTVLEGHLDTFSHVNNAVYLQLLEEARWDIIAKRGFGVKEIQQMGIGPVILEIQIRFIKELSLREKIVIETQCTTAELKIVKLAHEIKNSKGENCCTALFTIGVFDTKLRKLITPPAMWYHAIGVSLAN